MATSESIVISKESLECSICFQPYDEVIRCPRLLTCGHTFCSYCIPRICRHTNVQCPLDKSLTIYNDIKLLPKNFALLSLLKGKDQEKMEVNGEFPFCDSCDTRRHHATHKCVDCNEYLCKTALKFHKRNKASKNHLTFSAKDVKDNPSLGKVTVVCSEHNCEPFRYFDQDCHKPICCDCFALEHKNHKCIAISEAVADIKEEIKAAIDRASSLANELTEAGKKVHAEIEQQQNEFHYECHQVSRVFENLRQAVSERETALMSKLNRVCSDKTMCFGDHLNRLSVFNETLTGGIETAKSILDFPKEEAAFFMKEELVTMLDTLIAKVPKLMPPTTPHWSLIADTTDLINLIHSVGNIKSEVASGNYVNVSGEGIYTAHVYSLSSFVLSTFDFKGQSLPQSADDFEITMKKMSSEDEVEVQIVGHKSGFLEGKYHITNASQIGVWQLSITSKNGYCIRGNPFKVEVFPKFRFQKGSRENENIVHLDCNKLPSLIDPVLTCGSHSIDLCIKDIFVSYFEVGIAHNGDRCGFRWMEDNWDIYPVNKVKHKQLLHLEKPKTGTLVHVHVDIDKKLLFVSMNGRSRTFTNIVFPEGQFYVALQGSVELLT